MVMLHDPDLIRKIQTLFSDELMAEVETPDADLLQAGVLDSLKLVELLLHLEQRFGLTVAMEELDTEDFRSIHSIARLVAGRGAGQIAHD
jgi:methoxymalonate biosynthesis acyl carrier protein